MRGHLKKEHWVSSPRLYRRPFGIECAMDIRIFSNRCLCSAFEYTLSEALMLTSYIFNKVWTDGRWQSQDHAVTKQIPLAMQMQASFTTGSTEVVSPPAVPTASISRYINWAA